MSVSLCGRRLKGLWVLRVVLAVETFVSEVGRSISVHVTRCLGLYGCMYVRNQVTGVRRG